MVCTTVLDWTVETVRTVALQKQQSVKKCCKSVLFWPALIRLLPQSMTCKDISKKRLNYSFRSTPVILNEIKVPIGNAYGTSGRQFLQVYVAHNMIMLNYIGFRPTSVLLSKFIYIILYFTMFGNFYISIVSSHRTGTFLNVHFYAHL